MNLDLGLLLNILEVSGVSGLTADLGTCNSHSEEDQFLSYLGDLDA